MTISKVQIDQFLHSKTIAIAGVSKNHKKFGRMVYDELFKKGYNPIPINPSTDEINGNKCYQEVMALPDNVDALLIVTPKNQTDKILLSAIQKNIKNIWVQRHSETKNTTQIAQQYGREIITRKCIMMFANPVKGIHQFHRSLTGIFGQLPR